MLRSLFILGLAASALLIVSADTDVEPTDELDCEQNLDEAIRDGNAAFSGKFLYESVKASPGKNLIASPYSVFTPFAELALYANEGTLDQLMSVLNLQTKCDIRCVFPKLNRQLQEQSNVILNIASKIYATDQYPLTQTFLEDTNEVFGAVADSMDISDPQGTANKINQWVEDQTNNRIKDLVDKSMITPDTRLVLVNAIYFLGNWTNKFSAKNTLDRTFYINNDETVEVPTMYQQNTFKYAEDTDLDCKVLEMFYKGGNLSFVVILPNQIEGLNNLLEKLQDPTIFYNLYDKMSYEKVNVYLPKIKTDATFNLKDIMEKVGVVDILDPEKSNLSGIMEQEEPLYISAAVQKAFIEVTEEGTEAAAANAFVGARATAVFRPQPVKDFIADHPFAYLIMNNRNILFNGAHVTK